MEDFKAVVSDLYNYYEGNLMIGVITLIAFGITNSFDLLRLKSSFGPDIANILYLFISFIIYFVFSIVGQFLFILSKIEIVKSNEYYDERFTTPYRGKKFYGYLDVVIPPGWRITDCYVTLNKIFPIYYEDRVLLNADTIRQNPVITNLENRLLHWKSPLSYQNKTKINIGENSNKETFSIGKIITGKIMDTNGVYVDVKAFEFDIVRNNPNAIHFSRCGLYEFSVRFHWKRNGREMISKKADGYVYSRVDNGIREIRVGLGDYNKDNNIPKPLLKKIEEKPEQQKQKKRRDNLKIKSDKSRRPPPKHSRLKSRTKK